MVVYRWNVDLCQALYPTMHYFEVALRNRMHAAFTKYTGTGWWFEDSRLVRHEYARNAVTKALSSVKGREPTPGDVVAGVTFGFWRGFYLDPFESVWRKIMADTFPHVPDKLAKRKVMNTRVERFRRVRNRIAHHEPIFHWRSLAPTHHETHEMLGWLSSSALQELQTIDAFPVVHARAPRS